MCNFNADFVENFSGGIAPKLHYFAMDLSYNVQYNKLHDTSTTNNCTTTVLDTSNFYYNKNELEILGRAQDEVARRCKFDRGDNLMG